MPGAESYGAAVPAGVLLKLLSARVGARSHVVRTSPDAKNSRCPCPFSTTSPWTYSPHPALPGCWPLAPGGGGSHRPGSLSARVIGPMPASQMNDFPPGNVHLPATRPLSTSRDARGAGFPRRPRARVGSSVPSQARVPPRNRLSCEPPQATGETSHPHRSIGYSHTPRASSRNFESHHKISWMNGTSHTIY